jgi:uncharacterized protein (TIGR02186 family)
MFGRAFLAIVLLICAGLGPAAAQSRETVETDISSRNIAIESTFTGASIVVFGTITRSRQTAPEAGLYDLAIVIRGPEQPVLIRRKSRVLGIWINTESRPYQNVPGYYAVLSTRPLNEITDKKTLNKYGIGFDSLLIERAGVNGRQDPFREAVLRIRRDQGLYRDKETGAAFIGTSLFRATAELPANVPVGEYWVDVFVFREGKLIGEHSSTLTLRKQGFERFVYTLAFDRPLVYGLVAVAAAMIAGLLASAIFRRE